MSSEKKCAFKKARALSQKATHESAFWHNASCVGAAESWTRIHHVASLILFPILTLTRRTFDEHGSSCIAVRFDTLLVAIPGRR